MKSHKLDIVCFQEAKISKENLKVDYKKKGLVGLCGGEYESFWSCSTLEDKKGRAGVVTFVSPRYSPVSASDTLLGDEMMDREGRVIMTDHGAFYVVNVYVPWGGGRGEDGCYEDPSKGEHKARFLELLETACTRLRATKPVILVGDMNIGMDAKDVCKSRRGWPGFGYSSTERNWLGGMLGRKNEVGGGGSTEEKGEGGGDKAHFFVDVWREAHPEAEVFSCFEQRTDARARNEGSRIDYILVSQGDFFTGCIAPALEGRKKSAEVTSVGGIGGGGEGAIPCAEHTPTPVWASSISMEDWKSLQSTPGVAILKTPQHWSDHLALVLVCNSNVPLPQPHEPCALSSKKVFRFGGDLRRMWAAAPSSAVGGGGSAGAARIASAGGEVPLDRAARNAAAQGEKRGRDKEKEVSGEAGREVDVPPRPGTLFAFFKAPRDS